MIQLYFLYIEINISISRAIFYSFRVVEPSIFFPLFSFIYSNSLDHSYDPEKALDSWMSCLNEKGLCFIEWNKGDVNNRDHLPCPFTLPGTNLNPTTVPSGMFLSPGLIFFAFKSVRLAISAPHPALHL